MKKESMKENLPYCLTISQASKIFGIGEKTLRRFLKNHMDAEYVVQIGRHVRIKRDVFKVYLDENITVL